jgi:hypothetical protein
MAAFTSSGENFIVIAKYRWTLVTTAPLSITITAVAASNEIPQGPRSNNEKDSIGGWRPKGFIHIALDQGFRLGFQDGLEPVARVSTF